MSEPLWSEVDAYVEQMLVGEDPALDAAMRASEDGRPAADRADARPGQAPAPARAHARRP